MVRSIYVYSFVVARVVGAINKPKPDIMNITYQEAIKGYTYASTFNKYGQRLELMEHPVHGESSPVLIVDHKTESVFDSGDWDCDDMCQRDGDYKPYVVKAKDGGLMIVRDFELTDEMELAH